MSDDLLAFVQALDQADDYDDVVSSGKKKLGVLKLTLNNTNQVSLDDLETVEDTVNDQDTKKKKKKRSNLLQAPLPTALAKKVDAAVAMDVSKQEMSKWTPAINEYRDRDQLSFPLNPVVIQEPSLQDKLRGMAETNFERSYLALMTGGAQVDGDDKVKMELPENNKMDYELRAKKRSDDFFLGKKQAHQAKIKSKEYRRRLLKEKQRELMKNPLELALKSWGTKEQRDLQRAKERLTLKTRKAAQWASALLEHRTDSHDRRDIISHVKAKEQLRREIMGRASDSESDESVSDGEDLEDDMDMEVGSDNEPEESFQEITGDYSEEEMQVGKRSFQGAAVKVEEPDDVEEEEDAFKDHDSIATNIDQTQKQMSNREKLLKRAQQTKPVINPFIDSLVPVSREFEQLKAKEQEGEAPQVIDKTLSGWGSWTGPKAEELNKHRRKHVKVIEVKPGVEKHTRRDRNLRHVIFSEKRARGLDKLQISKVPYPFTSAEQYESFTADNPLGLEWNTVKSFKKKTAPRVKIAQGAVLEPLKKKHH